MASKILGLDCWGWGIQSDRTCSGVVERVAGAPGKFIELEGCAVPHSLRVFAIETSYSPIRCLTHGFDMTRD